MSDRRTGQGLFHTVRAVTGFGRKTGGNPVQTDGKVTFGRENGLESVRINELT